MWYIELELITIVLEHIVFMKKTIKILLSSYKTSLFNADILIFLR